MGKGFVGKAASNYFQRVDDTLEKSYQVEKNLFSIKQKNGNYETKQNNHFLSNISLSKGSQVVSIVDEKFEYILEKTNQTEEITKDKIFYLINQIRDLCTKDFCVPSVNPKIEKMLSDIENSLGEFEQVTNESVQVAKKFMFEINEIDQ